MEAVDELLTPVDVVIGVFELDLGVSWHASATSPPGSCRFESC